MNMATIAAAVHYFVIWNATS